jgi:enoyl-CoA hydratase
MDKDGIEGLVVRRERGLGRITLDRPKALNALTLEMVRGLATTLRRWASDPQISVIVLDGAGDRAFCAGGDIKSIFEADRSDGNAHARTFWREEYVLDHMISTYPKPIVALVSGIVMGGGAGLSVHARFRMVDETARFAMPETGIGLIPDVGGTRFLSRMPGEVGTYLALTGRTIDATNMIAGGLADVLVLRRDRARMLDGLDEIDATGPEAFALVDKVLQAASSPPGPPSFADGINIDRIFAGDDVDAILGRLAEDGSEWAQRTAMLILGQSPTSLKLTLAALRKARALPDLAETLKMEFRVVCRIAEAHDFYEGVRAAVVDKDRNPNWQPAALAEVSDAMVAAYFEPLGEAELQI